MQFNLNTVREFTRSAGDLNSYIEDVFRQCTENNETPLLSDIIAGVGNGGIPIMEALAHKFVEDRDIEYNDRFIWKLYVKRDEWGNTPCKGDVMIRRIQKPLQLRPGKPIVSDVLSMDKFNGTYDKKWHRYIDYKLDERGCITCEFMAASQLIRCFGIHPVSGIGGPPLSIHLQEHSTEPTDAPNGQKIHVWYHRLMEMDKAMYSKLPVLKKRVEPKRGFAPMEEIEAYRAKKEAEEKAKAEADARAKFETVK